MNVTGTTPDFAVYWQDVLDAVSVLSKDDAEIEELPIRSNETSIAYTVKFMGIDNYPLFAYFTTPRGDGPFPALFQTPGYGSVVGVPPYNRRSNFATMALCHRGQRLSDSIYSAAYPGLLTDGLPNADSYRWRYIVADCLRAIDVFTSIASVNSSRLAVVGMDLAAVTASLRPQTPFMMITSMIFRDAITRAKKTSSYPLQEFNDFSRMFPEHEQMIKDTVSLFDPLVFAPSIKATSLIFCGATEREYVEPVAKRISGECHIEFLTGRGFLDHEKEDLWLKKALEV